MKKLLMCDGRKAVIQKIKRGCIEKTSSLESATCIGDGRFKISIPAMESR